MSAYTLQPVEMSENNTRVSLDPSMVNAGTRACYRGTQWHSQEFATGGV